MVLDPKQGFPAVEGELQTIDVVTRREQNVYLDAQRLSEELLGDHMPANMLALGAAWQRGALPISLSAIEEAIRLNGAGVEKNLAAFAWGRAYVLDPDAVAAVVRPEEPKRADGLDGLLDVRVPELVEYQNKAYAEKYVEFVREVEAAEQERTPGSTAIAESVARHLFKLMAYKDEYEVARLHLASLPEEGRFWFHLHPPILRALGMKRKIKLGRWFVPAFRMLRSMRRLRGKAIDPFGHAKVRRVERELDRRVPRPRLALARAPRARHRPARSRDLRPAGRDPRLRGDQAALGQALPDDRGAPGAEARAGGRARSCGLKPERASCRQPRGRDSICNPSGCESKNDTRSVARPSSP